MFSSHATSKLVKGMRDFAGPVRSRVCTCVKSNHHWTKSAAEEERNEQCLAEEPNMLWCADWHDRAPHDRRLSSLDHALPPELCPWQCLPLQLILPARAVTAMWQRAEQWNVHAGGRFEAQGYTILVWSGPHVCRQAGAECHSALLGFVSITWESPTIGEATLSAMAWKPDAGGTQALMWQALSVLSGLSLAEIEAPMC